MSDKPGGGRGRAQFMKSVLNPQSTPETSGPCMKPSYAIAGRGMSFINNMMSGLSTDTSSSGASPLSTLPSSLKSPSIPSSTASTCAVLSSPSAIAVGGRGRILLNKDSAPASISTQTAVESITTTTAKTSLETTSATHLEQSEVVKRHGDSGEKIKATGNYILMDIRQGAAAFEYEVKFEPQQDAKALRFKLLRAHHQSLGPQTFDGSTLYLSQRLPSDTTVLQSQHPATQEQVAIMLIFKKEKKFGEMRHLYNVLFKRIMSELKLVEFKRHFFNPKDAHIIPQHKLEIWPGFVTTVDEYEGGLMLMIDPTHRVLRRQSVLSLIQDIARRGIRGWENEFKACVIGQTVMTTYNNMTYLVDDVNFSMNPMSTFFSREEQKDITYVSYYKAHYNIEITDMCQPLLIHRRERRQNIQEVTSVVMICLIPELCNLSGISNEMRSDFTLMKEMSKYTRITPNQRYYSIRQFVNNVNSNPNTKRMLSDWGLSIKPETVSLNARVLQPESICFADGKMCVGTVNADWGRDITGNKCITPIDIENWVILYTKKDSRCTKEFTDTILRCGPPMGLKVSYPQLICLPSDHSESYRSAIRNCLRQKVTIVVCICPTARDDRYAAIKKTCCVESPVASQVINSRTLCNPKNLRSVVQKVALQMNCKLGGTLWSVNIPFKQAMVVGIDVFHGAGKNSCAGFVASYNANMTRWTSHIVFQNNSQEIISGLKRSFLESIRYFYKHNGVLPSRIFIYRDGVGDGQIDLCKDFEIKQLESTFSLVAPDYNPPMIFILVQKRITTRIFADFNGGNQLENPNPGTVVDNTVTRRSLYDFFLVAQKVRQGTVTPTHFVVLHDTTGIKPDHVQRFTYKMCHLYYNWPGTVRVPAPCQYAHKLAFLMGQTVGKEHDESLQDRLFFL